MLGIGAIIGTGIFVLTAEAGQKAGPAMMLAFVIAAVVCGLAALAYSELAAMVPVSGSAYTYTYAVMGEALAWTVGWALVLEYAVAAGAVSAGRVVSRPRCDMGNAALKITSSTSNGPNTTKRYSCRNCRYCVIQGMPMAPSSGPSTVPMPPTMAKIIMSKVWCTPAMSGPMKRTKPAYRPPATPA